MAMILISAVKSIAPKSKVKIKDSTTVVHIPSNLEIRGLIRQSPIPVKLCRYNIHQQADKVAILLSQVTDRQSLKKSINLAMTQGYVNLNSKILQKLVRDYTIYLKWMINQGILECNQQYNAGVHSRSYRLGSIYRNQRKKEFVITDKTLVNKLTSIGICNSTRKKYRKLYHDLISLDIEFKSSMIDLSSFNFKRLALKGALEDINTELSSNKKSALHGMSKRQLWKEQKNIAVQKMDSWKTALIKIYEKQFYFKQDSTSCRLHTSALGLKNDLRRHLRINEDRLVACDIKNSQPYLSTAIFLNPKKCEPLIKSYLTKYGMYYKPWIIQAIYKMLDKYEKRDILDSTLKYIDLATTGRLYEFMAKELSNLTSKNWTREEAKLEMLKVLFCPPKFKKLAGRKVMKKHFPEVLRFISLLNSGFKFTKAQRTSCAHKSGPNVLALVLQKMESEVILNQVCSRISKDCPQIPLITLHDGIATTVGHQYLVQQIMVEELTKYVGTIPIVVIEWEKWGIGRYPAC